VSGEWLADHPVRVKRAESSSGTVPEAVDQQPIQRRLAAGAALTLAAVSAITAAVTVVINFPRGLFVLACLVAALVAGLEGVLHRGVLRWLGVVIAALALAGALVLLLGRDLVAILAIVITAVAAIAAARVAFAIHIRLPPATPPSHAVLFFNPRSGGGKAVRFHLAEEARRRGIEPIELTPRTTLESLVDAALAGGADALAMAGGDGSQAVVAAAAARAGVPYACIPAGTRNHFALDLGVDREDVVGALDAFVEGGERRVDLAEVNGRVFVNNVSLGFYADAVQRAGYREAKLRTLLDTVPEVAGPQATAPPLRWQGPDGISRQGGLALLISNNPYRLGRAVASGTRPRLDGGRLGVAVIGPRRDAGGPRRADDGPRRKEGRTDDGAGSGPMRTWSVPTLEVDSKAPMPAGIDGEAAVLDPPLRFASRPGVLRVRVAATHPGCSPSAALPQGSWAVPGALARIAFTRSG